MNVAVITETAISQGLTVGVQCADESDPGEISVDIDVDSTSVSDWTFLLTI
jgi:hypothetical protein